MDKQQVLKFLKDTSKTTLDICAEFGTSIAETKPFMEQLKRDGIVWQSKRRTMGIRNVSRWGLVE